MQKKMTFNWHIFLQTNWTSSWIYELRHRRIQWKSFIIVWVHHFPKPGINFFTSFIIFFHPCSLHWPTSGGESSEILNCFNIYKLIVGKAYWLYSHYHCIELIIANSVNYIFIFFIVSVIRIISLFLKSMIHQMWVWPRDLSSWCWFWWIPGAAAPELLWQTWPAAPGQEPPCPHHLQWR